MTFSARYEGKCESCEGRIKVGEEIASTEGGYVHADCRVKPREPMPVCPSCFIEMPATGVCDQCQ